MMEHRDNGDETKAGSAAGDIPRPLRWVSGLFLHLAAILLQLVAIGIVINAVYRYSLGGGFPLITETTRFVLLLVVFLGLAGTHLAGGHVRVELLAARLKGRMLGLLEGYLVPLVSLLFLGLIFYAGWHTTQNMFQYGTTTPSRPAVLLWPFMAVVPLGTGLLMVLLLIGLVRRVFGRRS